MDFCHGLFSVVPEDWNGARTFGVEPPGDLLEVGRRALAEEEHRSPLPRVEVWTAGGREESATIRGGRPV